MKILLPIIAICVLFLLANSYLYTNIILKSPASVLGTLSTNSFPHDKEISGWSWSNLSNLSQEDQIKLLNTTKQNGIQRIFISIDDYLDIYEQEDLSNKDRDIHEYENRLRLFISTASAKNIKIEALAGNPYWSNKSHDYLPRLIVDFVEQYNVKVESDEKFVGIHFDIEPYGQENFWTLSTIEKERILLDYFELVSYLNNRLATSSPEVRLTFDIPVWLDGTHPEIPLLNINEILKPFAFHMYDELGKYPNRYVTIMAYRNHAKGSNGSIELIKLGHTYLSLSNNSVGLIIGQETVYSDFKRITFFNKSKYLLRREINLINNHYNDSTTLKGFAIHDLSNFLSLDEK